MIIKLTNAIDGELLFVAADTIGLVCTPEGPRGETPPDARATVWVKGETEGPYMVKETPVEVASRWSTAMGCIIVVGDEVPQ